MVHAILFLLLNEHLITSVRLCRSIIFRSIFFSCFILRIVDLTNNSYLWLLIISFISRLGLSLSEVCWCGDFWVLRYLSVRGLDENTLWVISLSRFHSVFLWHARSSYLSHLLYVCRHIINTFSFWLSITIICSCASHRLEVIRVVRGFARAHLGWWILIWGILSGLI